MAVGDVYQLGVNQSLYGIHIANVYNFEQLVDVTPGTRPEDSLMQAFLEQVTPHQANMSVVGWNMNCFTARRVRPTGGPQFVLPASDVGVTIGQGNPASTCCLATLYSSTVGRRGRGRKFISGIAITSNDKGRLDNLAIIDFTTFMDAVIATIKWTGDNATFIIRILSTLDALIRNVQKYHARVALTKQSSRLGHVC